MQADEDADITNNMKLCSRDCIALGPSGNLQGSQKVFCLNTGQVLKCRTIHEFPMPDRTVARMNQWGIRSKRETYGRKLQFLNWSKDKYDWDNDEFEEDEGLVEATPLTHAEITAEIPVIEMENEQMHVKESPVQDYDISTGQQAEAAADNANIKLHETAGVVHHNTAGVYNGAPTPVHEIPYKEGEVDEPPENEDDADEVIHIRRNSSNGRSALP